MTRTIVESKTKTAIIGFDQPFCVIGERINPTGRKILSEELERGDFSRVEADAVAQVMAGANILDVNSGAVFSNKMAEDPRYADNNFVEPMLMKELIERVQAIVDVPLCIDSSVPGALENGLAAAEGRPLLNSVTGEEDRMEASQGSVRSTSSVFRSHDHGVSCTIIRRVGDGDSGSQSMALSVELYRLSTPRHPVFRSLSSASAFV